MCIMIMSQDLSTQSMHPDGIAHFPAPELTGQIFCLLFSMLYYTDMVLAKSGKTKVVRKVSDRCVQS